MKGKFIRRSLVDTIKLFDKILYNRSVDFNFKLKNKSSIILFFFLYISEFILNRVLLHRLILQLQLKLDKFDINIVYPPEGRVADKEFMRLYRRKYFKTRKLLYYAYLMKDYLKDKLNIIYNYSFGVKDIVLTKKLNSEFNFFNNALLYDFGFIDNSNIDAKVNDDLDLVKKKYFIDGSILLKLNKFIFNKFKSDNFIKVITLLQHQLNLKFISYFKLLYNMLMNKKYLLVNDYFNLLKDAKFITNFNYFELVKVIFINYIYTLFYSYSNSVNKKKIIMKIVEFYRYRLILC